MEKEPRRKGNRTAQLQVKHRNYRWRDMLGSSYVGGIAPWEPIPRHRSKTDLVAKGAVLKGESERRAKYREVTVKTQQILEQVLEASLEGKSAPEILNDLDFPDHS